MRPRFILNLLATFVALQTVSLAQEAVPPAAQVPVLVTISEKTTRITAPLKPSGYPDFLEAVNLQAKGKVTPETNGAILLVRATGFYVIAAEAEEAEFYRRLGMTPLPELPENHQRHVFHDDFIRNLQDSELPRPTGEDLKIEDDYQRTEAIRTRVAAEFEHCSEFPWTAKEHPIVARWLKEQGPSFAQLDKLRDYPDAYLPRTRGPIDGSLRTASAPMRRLIEKMALDLRLRAFYQIGLGRFDEALDDLERLFIFSRYVEKTPDAVSLFSAASLRGLAYPLVNEVSLNSKLTPAQLGRLKTLVQKYNPPLDEQLVNMVDQNERWLILESVCRFAEYGPGGTEAMPLANGQREDLDYDQMLNYLNPFYDRLAEALREKDPQKRNDLCLKLNEELTAIFTESNSKPRLVMLKLTKTGRTQLAAEKLLENLSVALTIARAINTKEKLRHELWQLSIALEEYRRKQGKFPQQLAQLVPDYLAALPLDPYTDEPLKYQSDGKGMLAYSLGYRGDDDLGFQGSTPDGADYDDIAIFTNDRRPKQPVATPPRNFLE